MNILEVIKHMFEKECQGHRFYQTQLGLLGNVNSEDCFSLLGRQSNNHEHPGEMEFHFIKWAYKTPGFGLMQ